MSEPNDSKADKPRSDALAFGRALAFAGAAFAAIYYLTRTAVQRAARSSSKGDEVWSYVIGYALALALTCAAFAAVRWQAWTRGTTLAIVLGLALGQMMVHFRWFLHITLRKSARGDLQLILFSAVIVILMISGTLVVLFNLRSRMM